MSYIMDSPSSALSDDLFANSSGRDVNFTPSAQNYGKSKEEQFDSHTLTTPEDLEASNGLIYRPKIVDTNSAFFRPISPDSVNRIEDSGNSSKSDNTNVDFDMETAVLHESMNKITLVDDSDKSSDSILDMSIESNDYKCPVQKSTIPNVFSSAKKQVIKNWLSNVTLNSSSKPQSESTKAKTNHCDKMNLKNSPCLNKLTSDNLNSQSKSNYSPKPLETRKESVNFNRANIKKEEALEKSDEQIGRYNLRRNRREGKENDHNDNKFEDISSKLCFNSKDESVHIKAPSVKKSVNEKSSNKVSYRQKKKLKIKNNKSVDEDDYISNIINSVMSPDDNSFSSIRRKSYATRKISNCNEDGTQLKYLGTPGSFITPRRKLFFRKALDNSLDDEICSEEPCQESLLANNAVTSTPMLKSVRLKGLSAFISETLNSSLRNMQDGDTNIESNGKSTPPRDGMNISTQSNKTGSASSSDQISPCTSTNKSRNISSGDNGKPIKNKNSNLAEETFENSENSLKDIESVFTSSDSSLSKSSHSHFELDTIKGCKPSIENVEEQSGRSGGYISNDPITENVCEQNNRSDSGKTGSNLLLKSTGNYNNSPGDKDMNYVNLDCTDVSMDSVIIDSSDNESFTVRRRVGNRNRINSNDFTHDELNSGENRDLTKPNISSGSSSDATNSNKSCDDVDKGGNESIQILGGNRDHDNTQNTTTMGNCSSNSVKVKKSLKYDKCTSFASDKRDSVSEKCFNNTISKQISEENTLPVNYEESFASIDSILCLKKEGKEKRNENSLHNPIEREDNDRTRAEEEGARSNRNTSGKGSTSITGDVLLQDRDAHAEIKEDINSQSNSSQISANNNINFSQEHEITTTKTHSFSMEDCNNGENIIIDEATKCSAQNISTIVLSDNDDSFSNICRSKTPLKKNKLNHSMEDNVVEIIDINDIAGPWKRNKGRRNKKSIEKYNPEVLIIKEYDSSFSSCDEGNDECHIIVNSDDESVKSSSSENEPWVNLADYLKNNIQATSKRDSGFPSVSKRTLADVQLPNHSSCPQHTSFLLSLTDSVPQEMCHPDAIKFRDSFPTHKNSLIDILFKLYNQEIFDNKLPVLDIKWSGHLTTTSGITKSSSRITKTGKVRASEIKLSKTIVDCAWKLRDTLIHELCHAANWLIDEQAGGHGPLFRKWADKVWYRFPEIPKVKVCHRYELKWKYLYKCTYCGYELGKMKLSLKEDCCRVCGGRVEVNTT